MTSTNSILASDFTFKGGDVRIEITLSGNVIYGMICSQALVLASPVWEELVYGSKGKGKSIELIEKGGKGKDKVGNVLVDTFKQRSVEDRKAIFELDFKDDDATMLLLLLRIAPSEFHVT